VPRGERHPTSKLTTQQVFTIRTYEGILSSQRVAELFDISRACVRKIWLKKMWQHLGEDSSDLPQKNKTLTRKQRVVIAERDGWRCHLCKKIVNVTAMSIDHLIPRIAGGTNDPQNLALAHIHCNKIRGVNRLPAQLRLFG
jgi:hypothetical protein